MRILYCLELLECKYVSEIDCLLSLLDSTGNLEIINQVKCIRKFHKILYHKYLRDCEIDDYLYNIGGNDNV